MLPITPSQAGLLDAIAQETPSPAHPDALTAAALESTRLAIARWTGGIHLPQMLMPGMVRVSPQARWFAQANNGFQEWVSQGGFARAADCDCQLQDLPAVKSLCNIDEDDDAAWAGCST